MVEMVFGGVAFILLFVKVVTSCPYILRSENSKNLPSKEQIHKLHNSFDLGDVADKRRYLRNPPNQGTTGNGAYCKKTNGVKLVTNANIVCKASKAIEKDFLKLYPSDDIGIGQIIGKAVRLPFHDAAEYDKNSWDKAGPDGCLSADPDNAGLIENTTIVTTLFEPIWQKYCDQISRADFWALIGAITIQHAEPTNTIKIAKMWGRVDAKECPVNGRLPDAELGLDSLEHPFVKNLGLTLNDAVALIGGHTVGHMHVEFSGYGLSPGLFFPDNLANAWDTTPNIFDNEYYKSVGNVGWGSDSVNALNALVGAPPVDPSKVVWLDGINNNVVLTTDMSIFFNISLENHGLTIPVQDVNVFIGGQVCGVINETAVARGTPNMITISPFGTFPIGPFNAKDLSPDAKRGCTSAGDAIGSKIMTFIGGESKTVKLANQFALDNNLFLKSFAKAFNKMLSVGYGKKGKLGKALQPICGGNDDNHHEDGDDEDENE